MNKLEYKGYYWNRQELEMFYIYFNGIDMYTNHTIYVTHLYLNKQYSTMKCRPKACNKCRKMASTHQDLSQAKYHGSRNNVFSGGNSVPQ